MSAAHPKHNDASLLDAVTAHLRGHSDLPIWGAIAQASGGPVLECGTGTGRVLGFLLEAGADAYGIESDESVLQIGQAHLASLNADHPSRLLLGDMTDFSHERRYRLILIPLNTVALLPDHQLIAALDCIRDHLQPGCDLGLDLDLQVVPPANSGPTEWTTEPQPVALRGGQAAQLWQTFRRAEGDRWEVTHHFDHEDGDVSTVSLSLVVRSLPQLTEVLDRAGWGVRSSIDEHGREVSEKSRLAFVLARPHPPTD